ncbi:MAG TPA: hypothetical protein VHK63_08175 [Candidatus Limnocylindria bacterium]|nr:hypothetical protein [Candidatus Limnocylindria bacterium]
MIAVDRRSWLLAAAGIGVVLLVLSFVPQWLVHDREVRGEGYRHVTITLSAWRVPAAPVLPAAIVASAFSALAAGVGLIGRPVPRWVGIGAAGVATLVLAAQLVPIARDGHTTSVDLRPAWALAVAIPLAALQLVASVAADRPIPRPPRPHAVLLVAAAVATVVLAGAGRQATLIAAEPTGEHWSEGTYVREATGAVPAATLVIADGRFEIAGRWSGTWEGVGLTVVIQGDPACPEARGAYHVHDEGPDGRDIRFVKVLDVCRDGERAEDLETGIWVRQD